MLHSILGFMLCSMAYIGFALTTNNLHQLFASFKLIDTVFTAVTGQKSDIRIYSNRFQMNLIANGLVLYIAIIVMDTTIYAM